VSALPFDGDRDDRNEAGCRQLLEMHKLRRGVERGAVANGSIRRASMALTRARVVRELFELVAPLIALEPHVSRGAP
jgi:hypothetical protein